MPSDKRDATRKSDRSSGSSSASRPSATVTTDSGSVVPSTSSRSEVTTSTTGTVHSVPSVSMAKRSSRGTAVVTSHSAPVLQSEMFDRSSLHMPTVSHDVCDDLRSDDDLDGAHRAPFTSMPVLSPASRQRRRVPRRQNVGWSAQSAPPVPYPFFPTFAYPSMAAAGRGAAGFGVGYAPSYGWPTPPLPYHWASHQDGSGADVLPPGDFGVRQSRRPRSTSRPSASVGFEPWGYDSRSPSPGSDEGTYWPDDLPASVATTAGADHRYRPEGLPARVATTAGVVSSHGHSGLPASVATTAGADYYFGHDDHPANAEANAGFDVDYEPIDALSDGDQEIPASAVQSLHDALASHSDVLSVSDKRPEAQSSSERFLGLDFIHKSRPQIAESPLIGKALTSARKRLTTPGAARTVAHPGLESDQSVLGRPVGDLVPNVNNPFLSSVGWTFPSFPDRFNSLAVSSGELSRFGASTGKPCQVSFANLKSLETASARSLAGVGTLDTLFAALMSAITTPGDPDFSLAMDPDVSSAEVLVKEIVRKMHQSAADLATLYTNVILLRRDHVLASSALPADVRALMRSAPIQQPWLFGPAAAKILSSAAESASRELALSALSAQAAGRSAPTKRKQSSDPRRAKAPRLGPVQQPRRSFPRPPAPRGGRGGPRRQSRPSQPRQRSATAGSSSVQKNPQ